MPQDNATRRWTGNAVNIKQVDTITVADTWAADDTVTLTINGNDLVITIGTDTTTAQVATAIKEAVMGAEADQTGTGDHSFSPTAGGQAIPEFTEITATVSSSVVTLTANTAGIPFTLSVTESTAGDGTATEATATSATGSNFFSNADNWTGATVPVDNDDIVFDSGDVDCLYGLAPAIQPGSFKRLSSYTGKIGLPEENANGYREYRTTYLTFDDNSVTCIYTIEGANGRLKLDAGAGQSTFNVNGRGQREDSEVPEILIKGTNTSNILNIQRGDVGVAFYAGEDAALATLRVGFIDNRDSDAVVFCGSGMSQLTSIEKDGGQLTVNSTFNDITQRAGTTTVNGTSGVGGAQKIRGGNYVFNTTGIAVGTITLSNDAVLDFSQDMQGKSIISAIEVEDQQVTIKDPFKVVSSLILDFNESRLFSDRLDIGDDFRLTRGAVA